MNVFKAFVESDIFGFEDLEQKKQEDNPFLTSDKEGEDEEPVKSFSVQWLMDTLARKRLGKSIKASHAFLDKVQWGKEDGAVRVRLTPNITMFIERLITDKLGQPTWITKRVFKPRVKDFAGHEEIVANDVFNEVEALYYAELESAADNYPLLSLVKRMSGRARAAAPDIFIYQDIKEVKPDYFIIYFSLRGVGVGKLTSRIGQVNQTPEATIDVHFDKKRGLIHVIVGTVAIGGRGDDWVVDIPFLDAFFTPTQPKDEIIDTVLTTLKYF